MLGRTRTVVVLEGDGVLWGGQAEQRGATGIELSRRDRSRGYIQVQEACLNLRRRGIQLALATRTSKEDVLDAMTQHPQMRLRPDHFAHMEMRWTDKATMLRNVCEALDVCEDKLVYVDSSRSECSWIRSTMVDVEVVSFDTPAELAGILTQHIAFESDRLFLESETPLTHLQPWTTSNSQVGFLEGIEGYLESLETRVRVGMASRFELPKLHTAFRGGEHVELSGRELTASVAHMAAQNPRCMVWWIRLEDRFEDDSVVGLAVFHRGDEVWTLQHFMLASHVMARGVDSVVMANLADVAREEGVNRIEVHCVRRDGNAGVPGSSFEAMGLARTGFSNDGVTYSLPLEGDSQQTLWRPSYVQCKVVEVQEREEEAAA
jgi:FkbH-like protein